MTKIVYTLTDEAPMLATHSLLPIVRAFAGAAGVELETADISLAARILAKFPESLTAQQRVSDALGGLGELVKRPEANIVKLPNISASVPQLKAAIAELQGKGFAVPDFPDEPETDADRETRSRYDAVKGSAANPVLRMGNSDRRAPAAIKAYARAHPHTMAPWSADSHAEVVTMKRGDFRANEKSVVFDAPTRITIQLVDESGAVQALRADLPVQAGEIFDGTVMSAAALDRFLHDQIERARDLGVLFSVHLKATMMKVSDPIIFGHVVRAFFPDVFVNFADAFQVAGLTANNGLGSVVDGLDRLPLELRDAVSDAIDHDLAVGPALAMVDAARGRTNLHVPNDVIIDASMPAMIRNGGKMRDAEGNLADALAVIPDSSYAGVYAATVEDCKRNGAFDPATLGTVPNVGLMAQKAEEYGSHDKTFEIPRAGRVQVVDADGVVLFEHAVAPGDIWRGCQTKDAPIRDWVHLAVVRARATGVPAVFWLDDTRAHDRIMIVKVRACLAGEDVDGLDLRILSPIEATKFTLARFRAGEDTISVTGNVLRDFLTDLFPIMEVGTSSKMLSVVPLMAGGGLFETGAGGTAPDLMRQVLAENHFIWDSLGEYFAIGESLRHEAAVDGLTEAKVLGDALDRATGRMLDENRSPKSAIGELDDRGSHFYLALYWAQEAASQSESEALAAVFAPFAGALAANEQTILDELAAAQGGKVELGGYYLPDPAVVDAVMRPSGTFNRVLADFAGRR